MKYFFILAPASIVYEFMRLFLLFMKFASIMKCFGTIDRHYKDHLKIRVFLLPGKFV